MDSTINNCSFTNEISTLFDSINASLTLEMQQELLKLDTKPHTMPDVKGLIRKACSIASLVSPSLPNKSGSCEMLENPLLSSLSLDQLEPSEELTQWMNLVSKHLNLAESPCPSLVPTTGSCVSIPEQYKCMSDLYKLMELLAMEFYYQQGEEVANALGIKPLSKKPNNLILQASRLESIFNDQDCTSNKNRAVRFEKFPNPLLDTIGEESNIEGEGEVEQKSRRSKKTSKIKSLHRNHHHDHQNSIVKTSSLIKDQNQPIEKMDKIPIITLSGLTDNDEQKSPIMLNKPCTSICDMGVEFLAETENEINRILQKSECLISEEISFLSPSSQQSPPLSDRYRTIEVSRRSDFSISMEIELERILSNDGLNPHRQLDDRNNPFRNSLDVRSFNRSKEPKILKPRRGSAPDLESPSTGNTPISQIKVVPEKKGKNWSTLFGSMKQWWNKTKWNRLRN